MTRVLGADSQRFWLWQAHPSGYPIGVGFQRGTHRRWQLVTNDGTGAPTLTDMGASFGIATGGVLTLFIAALPNGTSVWVRVVDGKRCLKAVGISA